MTPEDLVAGLAAFRSDEPPVPGSALRELFASGLVVAPAAVTTPAPARRTPMSVPKRFLAAVPSKIAAGVLGALLAGSLGAGAMTGTITLTSEESDAPVEVEAVEETEVDEAVVEETEVADVEEAEVVEVEEESDEPKADAGDPMTAPIPTSVSEAAHNHQFDEACGNHGAYVSHFARTGEEPECALTARAGGEPEATDVEVGTTDADAEAEVEDEAPKGKAKAEAKKAAKAPKAAKGKAARSQV